MHEKTPFTPGMREVTKLSKAEAGRFGHDFIAPEHLLLGMIRKGSGLGLRALHVLHISLYELRVRLEQKLSVNAPRSVPADPSDPVTARSSDPAELTHPTVFPPKPSTKAVLDKAVQIARAMKHSWIGTEHLLLALIAESDTVPSGILQQMGVTYMAAERAVLKVIDGAWTDPRLMETWSPTLREVFWGSLDEAYRLGHDHVGPEHFLLGILRKKGGLGCEMLTRLAVDLSQLQNRVEELLKAQPPSNKAELPEKMDQFCDELKDWMNSTIHPEDEPQGSPEFVSAAQLLLRMTLIASGMGHKSHGTEHLLLALIAEPHTMAGRCLEEMGVTYDTGVVALTHSLEATRPQSRPRTCAKCGSDEIELSEQTVLCKSCGASAHPVVSWHWTGGRRGNT